MTMNKPNWDTMEARGRDALVATKVFDWQYRDYGNGGGEWTLDRIKQAFGGMYGGSLPHYSTSIADAWLVVEKMREKGHNCQIEASAAQPEWIACFLTPHGYREGRAPTAPAAICLTALRALGAIS